MVPALTVTAGTSFNSSKICLLTKFAARNLTGFPTFPPKFENIYEKAKYFGDHTAIVDHLGKYTYADLLRLSDQFAKRLGEIEPDNVQKDQKKIAFLCPSDLTYVTTQWSCWKRGFVAVPLCDKHPPNLLKYYVNDAKCQALITTEGFKNVLKPIAHQLKIPIIQIEHPNKVVDSSEGTPPPPEYAIRKPESAAMFVYTSGTTGPPKGVILSRHNLHVQASAVNAAWEISSNDVIIHALPLHHLHGILNGLISPLYAGASVVLLPKFDAKEIWSWFLGERSVQPTVFHGVPTMYSFLIEEMNKSLATSSRKLDFIRDHCKSKIRFMACGSSSLPTPISHEWERLTGHSLIERYGMTELGMVLTNPLRGQRKAGSVGLPFPGIQARISEYKVLVQGNDSKTEVIVENGGIGELQIKGPNVFRGYWNRAKATEESFTRDGWFKTGDTAQYINGSYRILGRTSVDIIKSGGYKISALDVECHLLANPKIKECAVLGLPDAAWGQIVVAVVVPAQNLTLEEVREWCRDKLPHYSLPRAIECLNELPKNLLGKVNKRQLTKQISADKLGTDAP